jgi:hypothetical protein
LKAPRPASAGGESRLYRHVGTTSTTTSNLNLKLTATTGHGVRRLQQQRRGAERPPQIRRQVRRLPQAHAGSGASVGAPVVWSSLALRLSSRSRVAQASTEKPSGCCSLHRPSRPLEPFAERMGQCPRITDLEQFEFASGQSRRVRSSSSKRSEGSFRFNI